MEAEQLGTHILFTSLRNWEDTGGNGVLWNLEAHSQWHTASNTFLSSPTVLLIGDQAFKHMGGHSFQTTTPSDSWVLLLGIYPKEKRSTHWRCLHSYVHCSDAHHSQDRKLKPKCLLSAKWMKKMWCTCEVWTPIICDIGRPQEY